MRAFACRTDFPLVGFAQIRPNTGMDKGMPKASIPANDPAPASREEQLVAVGQHQDRRAFIALFEHYAPRIKSFLMKGGMSPEQAEELAQETMLTVWNRAESYDPRQAGAGTWIFTIARNKKVDLIRRTRRPEYDSSDPLLVADNADLPGETLNREQETAIIARSLQSLPAEQADLVRKAFFEDKTHSVIALETKLPLGTVKSRIRLALERLRADAGVKRLWH